MASRKPRQKADPNAAIINKEHMWTLLLCSVRYALGRATYMPHYVIELVERYRGLITDNQFRQIVEEVKKELEIYESNSRTLGHDIDHRAWRAFVERHTEYTLL